MRGFIQDSLQSKLLVLVYSRGVIMNKINEDSQLYKGIFWITDLDNISNNELYFQIPVDFLGNIDPSVDRIRLNSKNNDNYNHKNMWNDLSSRQTHNKSFDYYPRGRVEIMNGKAVIYANPNICTSEVVDWIKDRFNLTNHNGIKSVKVMPDHSEHYKCYLD